MMKKIKFTSFLVILLASFALVFTGCESDGPFEEAGEEVDDALD